MFGHAVDDTSGRSQTSPAKSIAVRSASVTGGMDVSTHTVPDDMPSQGDQPEGSAVPASAGGQVGHGRASRGLPRCRLPPGRPRLFHHPRRSSSGGTSGRAPVVGLTCGCGDPAQEVWFTAWPPRPSAHLHSLVFSARERPQRRQPALEHVGPARRRRARPGHLALRSRHRHQRRAHPGPGPRVPGPVSPPSARSSRGRPPPSRPRSSSATRRPSSPRSPSATCR